MAPLTQLTHQRARENWKDNFVAIYALTGNVSAACRQAGVTRQGAYKARQTDADFAEAWDEAKESATDLLFQEAWRRATAGRPEPVFYKGEVVGEVMRYSDFLLWKLLSALRPDEFGGKTRVDHSGRDDGPMPIGSIEELDRQIAQLVAEIQGRPEHGSAADAR